MRSSINAALCSVLVLGGCAAQETFVRDGIPYSTLETDRAECATRAVQQIPPNRSQGAEVVVALITGVYAVQDANATAREANFGSCMMSKGYQRVELPYCTNIQEARDNGVGPLTATRSIKITSQSCVINDNAGRIIFHNPAS